jgi:hypothetical protein
MYSKISIKQNSGYPDIWILCGNVEVADCKCVTSCISLSLCVCVSDRSFTTYRESSLYISFFVL